MFPGPNATVYYNDAGEPLGWSDESYFEPDPYDDDDRDFEHMYESRYDEDYELDRAETAYERSIGLDFREP